jgi:hypothetical protein
MRSLDHREKTHDLYCLGTVYEEYNRGYGNVEQLDKSLQYLSLAEQELLPAERWQTLLTTTHAVNLVRRESSMKEYRRLASRSFSSFVRA